MTRKPTASPKRARTQSAIRHFSPILGDIDLHLFGEGKHERVYEKLGAHPLTHEGKRGVAFGVWAPNANNVSVVGNFNSWDSTTHRMRRHGDSGVWELFIPGLKQGELYKYAIDSPRGEIFKADPYAFIMEVPPNTSSIVYKSRYKFRDRSWIKNRAKRQAWREPCSIYEVHLGSWRRITEEGNRPLTYREIAPLLAEYAIRDGFTHVEFLPLKEHPDWGTYIFNYGRNEVRNFLIANALFWLREFHLDGLRVDAVASMLYLDYSRKEGEWVPNQFGGRENLEAISFLKELNEVTHRECPGTLMIAEESTAWPAVSHPVYAGGLGFDFKWNMGWMHDSLKYFQTDPLFRGGNHNALTFGLLYAWSENFILPFSHDEVVHMKGALINKMPGDEWQKFANLRALYGYMWAHPGKKLLFMGGEFGQWREWTETESLDWHLLETPIHKGVLTLIDDLNELYQKHCALWESDSDPSGFSWIEVNNAAENVIAFRRISPSTGSEIIFVGNFSPVVRENHRLGLPHKGSYKQILNTDSGKYGGSGVGVVRSIKAEKVPSHGLDYSAAITLPPLATMWFEGPGK